MISILRKGFLLLIFVLVLAIVLGLIFGGDSLFSHALRKYGPAAFRQPVDFTAAQLSVLGGSAGVDDFAVGTEEYPLIDIGRAEIDISTMAVLDGRVVIENAELTGALLHLIVRPDGTLAFDPGPPPPEVVAEEGPVEESADLPPAEDRDFVQIAMEYWERYQKYREYYDMLLVGGEDGEEGPEEEDLRRAKYPGMPDYVTAARAVQAQEEPGAFWLEQASITDFNWSTLDKRNGEAILPAVSDFTFRLANIGTPPGEEQPAALYEGSGGLDVGGTLGFKLSLARDGSASTLDFTAEQLPIDPLTGLVNASLPFSIAGGRLDVLTEAVAFTPESLGGSVRLVLHGASLQPKANSPQVLGVSAREFCTLLNAALQKEPVTFVINLGGTPSDPSFDVENETDLGDMLGGAIQAEVERRAGEFIDEKTEELQERLEEQLGDKAGDLLKDKVDLGGLFGGR